MAVAPPPGAHAARAALAAEWAARAPRTPAEIARFYAESEHLAADLEAFHASPARRRWTEIAVLAATTKQAKIVVDVGCGAGHDLRALRAACGPDVLLYGVEPNAALRAEINRGTARCVADVADAPIGEADLITCFDVLEHVPDPEAFMAGIARRAKLGAYFIETTATADCGTPLHLRENRGWHPGHALEAAGWERTDTEGRLRIWRRFQTEAPPRARLVVCAYRSVSIPTLRSLLEVERHRHETGWSVAIGGEAGINRSRSIQSSMWLRETADDVLVMIDDDITFGVQDVDKLIGLCREKRGIVCAAYPVRDAGHVALRGNDGYLEFGTEVPPRQIRHGATGFMAVHRDVFEAMRPVLPLCHGNQPWAFWPFFDFAVIPDEAAGGHNYLSEDYLFCERAAGLGYATWVDPRIILGHLAQVELSVANMDAVRAALAAPGRPAEGDD